MKIPFEKICRDFSEVCVELLTMCCAIRRFSTLNFPHRGADPYRVSSYLEKLARVNIIAKERICGKVHGHCFGFVMSASRVLLQTPSRDVAEVRRIINTLDMEEVKALSLIQPCFFFRKAPSAAMHQQFYSTLLGIPDLEVDAVRRVPESLSKECLVQCYFRQAGEPTGHVILWCEGKKPLLFDPNYGVLSSALKLRKIYPGARAEYFVVMSRRG